MEKAASAIYGFACALDMTRRDLQAKAKASAGAVERVAITMPALDLSKHLPAGHDVVRLQERLALPGGGSLAWLRACCAELPPLLNNQPSAPPAT